MSNVNSAPTSSRPRDFCGAGAGSSAVSREVGGSKVFASHV